ncbi:ZN438 protein, partial [Upupa epops]|nr:ZN438 protein [Upupa epops]
AGGGFAHANPAENHRVQQSVLGQQRREACAGKTASTDKHRSASDLIQSFQKKSHFRTIAPKMVPKLVTSGVVPCFQSSLPEQNASTSAAASKPLVVPTQNYAVMQVPGHEGTFSLVALPYVAPALTQQIQQSSVAPSENLKLPIPRYQHGRNKWPSDKKPAPTSAVGALNKIPTKASVSSQTALTEDCPEKQTGSESAEGAMLTGHDSAGIAVATSAYKSKCVESGSEIAPADASGPCVVKDSLSKLAATIEPMKQSLCSVKTESETTEESVVISEKLKEKSTASPRPVAALSPALLGSAAQTTPSALKGKLPILPYSRKCCKSKQNAGVRGASDPPLKFECEKTPASAKTSDEPTAGEDPSSPSSAVDVDSLKKLSGAAPKRRGRKRRAPDDALAFQTKRRKCISKFREGRERGKADPQTPENRKAEAMKKYRSIRPKPVVLVQAFAPLPPAAIVETTSPDHLDQETFFRSSLPSKYFSYSLGDAASATPSAFSGNARPAVPKPLHVCHVCNRVFQFKHHLQNHLNTHTNKRPYSCRLCRKAYIHSGSLSTHMKLHHGEGKLRKLVCCEFCAKVFGHARVYFGHLREVHRVAISTEPCTSEQQMQDALKKKDATRKEAEEATERGNKCNFEDLFHNQGEEKIQIKCGRCQFIAESFGEMKFHLLCSHGEEIQGRVKEGVLQGNRGAKGELIRHSTRFWKQHERRHLATCSTHEEECCTFPKLRRQMHFQHQNNADKIPESQPTPSGSGEAAKLMPAVGFGTPSSKLEALSKAGYNCILCKQLFGRKDDLCNHWQCHHNCEDPSVLWTIFSSLSKQGVVELSA